MIEQGIPLEDIVEGHKEAVRNFLRDYQEKAMSKKPEHMYSKLTLAGSDSVDELVHRCKGDYQQAESILHSMLDNYLHFESMSRERDLGSINRLQCEQKHIREEIQEMAATPLITDGRFSARVVAKLERLVKNQTTIKELLAKLDNPPSRPARQSPTSWGVKV